MKNNIFRLRLNNKKVGYKKFHSSSMFFYSVDLYGWSSKEIDHNEIDHSTSKKDKNNRLLFEGDLIKLKHYPEHFGLIYYDHTHLEFITLLFNDDEIFRPSFILNETQPSHLTFYAYIFENEEICGQLKEWFSQQNLLFKF